MRTINHLLNPPPRRPAEIIAVTRDGRVIYDNGLIRYIDKRKKLVVETPPPDFVHRPTLNVRPSAPPQSQCP